MAVFARQPKKVAVITRSEVVIRQGFTVVLVPKVSVLEIFDDNYYLLVSKVDLFSYRTAARLIP